MSGVENLSSIACSQDKEERDLNVTYPLWGGGSGRKDVVPTTTLCRESTKSFYIMWMYQNAIEFQSRTALVRYTNTVNQNFVYD